MYERLAIWYTSHPHPCRIRHRAESTHLVNTARPRQYGHHSVDNIFKGIFLNLQIYFYECFEWIIIEFVPRSPVDRKSRRFRWWRRADCQATGHSMLSLYLWIPRQRWPTHMQTTLRTNCLRKYIAKSLTHHLFMMTLSNGKFAALLALYAGNSPVTGEFPTQRPVTRSFDVFFDLRLNKRLSKQSWGWWFETPSRPLWCHCNVLHGFHAHMPAI